MAAAATLTRPPFPPVQSARDKRERDKAERARILNLIPRDDAPLSRANLRLIKEADRQAAIVLSYRLRVEESLKRDPVTGRRLSNIVVTREERDAAVNARRKAEATLAVVERDLRARTDLRYADRVNRETEALEEARDEIVERTLIHVGAWQRDERGGLVLVKGLPVLVWDDAEPLRIKTRDGLEVLRDITPEQTLKQGMMPISGVAYEAGKRYQELYEKADPERVLRPAPELDPALRGGSGPRHGGDGWEDKRLQFSNEVARIEALVREGAAVLGSDGELWVKALREVAGKGNPISKCASHWRARLRWRTALECALDLCADYFGLH